MTDRRPAKLVQDDIISRNILLGQDARLRWGRRLYAKLPSAPRCKLCAVPFHAPFGPLMRLRGKAPWPKNPNYCSACFDQLTRHRAGAEIECSLLFADVRGSTQLAEKMRPTEFRELMTGFYETAARVLVDHDAVVDKFVGDAVIGIFIPALTGERHARSAVDAGKRLLAATGRRPPDGAALPVGAGVNTGIAFVGAVGDGDQMELSALGDAVNVTARLSAAAGPGELLVTAAAAQAAELPAGDHERRSLPLKGRSEPVDVLVFRPTA